MGMTSKDTIYKVVWKACDSLRGTMDSSQYKDFALTFLFVKYLSDFYKEKKEEFKKKYGDHPDRIEKQIKLEKFVLDDSCTFDFLVENKNKDNIGEIINKALERIEEDNRIKLDGIFRNIDFNSESSLGRTKERNQILKNLIEDFSGEELDLRPSKLEGNDVIGDAYEYLISRFAGDAGKKGGEFYTPSEVSTLLAKLVHAGEGSRIYDPTCGSGSLLIKASKEVGSRNFQLYGQEKNGQTHALCKMNMFLHDINDAKIEWGDTIRNSLHKENDSHMKFDVVVANPPFSLDKWGAEEVTNDPRFSFGIPPKSKGDLAFLQHMLYSLNDNGTAGVILPHGVLFRGATEGKIRQKIIENNYLDAVIGLPSNLFYGTSIPACILILKKGRTTKDVLFIDGSGQFKKEKNQNKMEDQNILKIYEAYKNRKDVEKFSHVATFEEIQGNDFNLNIPRYVDTFEEEDFVEMDSLKGEISEIEGELRGIKNKMGKILEELGL